MKALAVLVACLLVLSASFAAAEVKDLKSASFDSAIKEADIAIVKFFAPWCGHCKKLAPEFVAASEKLGSKALLAEVNCDEEKELCGKFEVRGYPTLFVFRKGIKSEDYSGGRTADDIVKYVNANSGPAVTHVASKAEYEKVAPVDAKVLVMTASKDSALAKAIDAAAPALRTSLSFAVATSRDVAPEVEMESVVVQHEDGYAETYKAGDKVDQSALVTFLKRARVPLLGAVGPSSIQMYNEHSSSSIGWLFLDATNRDKHLKEFTEVAKKVRKDMLMLWVDTTMYGGVAGQLGIPADAKYPAFVIDKKRKHFVLPTDKAATAESITKFAEQYFKGEVKPTIKSAPVPEKETVDGMTTIVGSRLRPILAQGKDTMVLFYAPWCGHCKNFHPTYDEVAKKLEKSDIIIAKMDATENDIDHEDMPVEGFPTIYFVKAGGAKPITYNGDRSLDDVIKFIKSNAKASIEEVKAADNSDATDL